MFFSGTLVLILKDQIATCTFVCFRSLTNHVHYKINLFSDRKKIEFSIGAVYICSLLQFSFAILKRLMGQPLLIYVARRKNTFL